MRHRKRGRKFGRTSDQRKALMRTLAFQLIMRERIKTSSAKAKEIRPIVEGMITRAKMDTLANRRHLLSELPLPAVEKLFKTVGGRFSQRKGGYTRIIKLGARSSDSSDQSLIEFVA